MKKPIHGDPLSILYNGALVNATCSEITETPTAGPGAARLTILSRTLFKNGAEAKLMDGPNELALVVDRVTEMRHRNLNIVSFRGVFEPRAH